MRCIKCGVETKQALCSVCLGVHNKLTYGAKKPRAAAGNCRECELYKNHTCMATTDYINNPGRKNC